MDCGVCLDKLAGKTVLELPCGHCFDTVRGLPATEAWRAFPQFSFALPGSRSERWRASVNRCTAPSAGVHRPLAQGEPHLPDLPLGVP